MTRAEIPGQLSFADLHLRVIAQGLPERLPPVMRWRKLVRRMGPPPGSPVSVPCFRGVAGVLADYANREGRSCFPSVETIAEDAGYSVRSVQYALRALEERRLIIADSKKGGRRRTTRWTLNVPSPVKKVVDDGGLVEAKGAGAVTERVQPVAPEVRHAEDRHLREPARVGDVDLWTIVGGVA